MASASHTPLYGSHRHVCADWSSFALRFPESAADSIIAHLQAIPASRVAALKDGVRRVRPRFLYGLGEPFSSSYVGGGASQLAFEAVAAAAGSNTCTARASASHDAARGAPGAAETGEASNGNREGGREGGVAEDGEDEMLLLAADGDDAASLSMMSDDERLDIEMPPIGTLSTRGVGTRVRLMKLAGRSELNGEVGTIEHAVRGGRYVVRLVGNGEPCLVRAANLMNASELPRLEEEVL